MSIKGDIYGSSIYDDCCGYFFFLKDFEMSLVYICFLKYLVFVEVILKGY